MRVISGDTARDAEGQRRLFVAHHLHGRQCRDRCRASNLKDILVEAAARKLEARPDDVECAGGEFRVGSGEQSALSFADVVTAALVDEGAITVKGTFTCPPESQGGKHRGGAVGSTMGFSYAAQVVEVSVDDATGLVTVDKVWTALDCGHAINPLAVEGQVEGSVWMGMGQAMCEETRYLEGLPAHASLLEYRVPTIAESPPIEVQIVESHDPYGPFGAKEASEGALAGFPPALVNAIANALGIDLDELPVTPDRVIDALTATAPAGAARFARGRPRHDRAAADFRVVRPRTVEDAVAARRDQHPKAASSPAAPISWSTCAAASASRSC